MALRFRNRTERSQPRHESATEPNIAPLTLTQRHEEAEMSKVEHAALLAGRLIFGGYFLYSGIRHFTDLEMMASYAKSKGIAWPNIAVLGSGSMLMIGGLSLLTGVKPKVGAGLVTAFLAGVTPQMHDYWNIEDPGQRMNEMVNFTKNLALMGGAAFAAATRERWPLSAA